jgi:hypothetical protein
VSDIQQWESLLAAFASLFNAPSFVIFTRIASAWALCPGRRTITRLYTLAELHRSKAHDPITALFEKRIGMPCIYGKSLLN